IGSTSPFTPFAANQSRFGRGVDSSGVLCPSSVSGRSPNPSKMTRRILRSSMWTRGRVVPSIWFWSPVKEAVGTDAESPSNRSRRADDPAVRHLEGRISDLGRVRIMADEEHGLAPLSAGGAEEAQQRDRILRIQLSRRLIGEDK